MNSVLLSSSVGRFLVVKNSLAMDRRHSFSEHISVRIPDTFATPSDCSVYELWSVTERRTQCGYQKTVGSKRRGMDDTKTNLKEYG